MKQFKYVALNGEEDPLRPIYRRSYSNLQFSRISYLHTKSKFKSSGKAFFSYSSSSKQRCFTKFSVRYGKASLIKHLEYIKKNEKGVNNDEPVIEGNFYTDISLANDKQFRLILSPEHQGVDVSLLSKKLIQKIELSTGFELLYCFAVHNDTEHTHSHILINGIEKNGKSVVFSKNHLSHLFREFAQDICTNMVGYRTQEEVSKSFYNQIIANRFTPLDKTLNSIIPKHSGSVSKDFLCSVPNSSILFNRISFLSELHLCRYDNTSKKYSFHSDCFEYLKYMSKYPSLLNARDDFNVADITNIKVHIPARDGPVSGKVLNRYFMQINADSHSLLLKDSSGSLIFVPLKFPPSTITNGDSIKISYDLQHGISEKGKTSIVKL